MLQLKSVNQSEYQQELADHPAWRLTPTLDWLRLEIGQKSGQKTGSKNEALSKFQTLFRDSWMRFQTDKFCHPLVMDVGFQPGLCTTKKLIKSQARRT